jgi:hypothetical protein
VIGRSDFPSLLFFTVGLTDGNCDKSVTNNKYPASAIEKFLFVVCFWIILDSKQQHSYFETLVKKGKAFSNVPGTISRDGLLSSNLSFDSVIFVALVFFIVRESPTL